MNSRNISNRFVALFVSLTSLFLLTIPAGIHSKRIAANRTAPSGPVEASPERTGLSANAPADIAKRARVNSSYGKLPLSFERNEGQADSRVRFISHAEAETLFLTPTEAVLTLRGQEPEARPADRPPAMEAVAGSVSRSVSKAEPESSKASVLRMKLVGANPVAKITGLDELPGKTNYLIGNDPKKWRVNVVTYAKVKYEEVYPGIDLVYYGTQRQLEYDLIVAPGADPGQIELAFDGATRVILDESGDLVLTSETGETRQHKPVVYQQSGGVRKIVAARYVMRGTRQVGFDLERYDASTALVIDPVLVYSTYLGGTDTDFATGIAVDDSGCAYVTGSTQSPDFPTVGAIQPLTRVAEVFVTKLNTTGSALVYSTFLGGLGNDTANGIAVDQFGNAYVTGLTFSPDFPTVNAFQPVIKGFVEDAFLSKLSPTGNSLVYSTFLGGSSQDIGRGVAADAQGNAYVTGITFSSDFPAANAAQPAYGLRADAFAAKFSNSGQLVYSTYLGGAGDDGGFGIAADSGGNAYVTGFTSSPNFPTANPLQATFKGKSVFKSTDAGGMWSNKNNGLPGHLQVNSLAIDPVSPSTLFAGTFGGVFKSTDGGGSWSLVFSPAFGVAPPNFKAVAIDPINPSNVFAGWGAGVSRSTDGGMTWSDPTSSRFTTRAVAVDPVTTSTIYAGTMFGLFKSTDGGVSWKVPAGPINSTAISSIAIDPTRPSTLFASVGRRFFSGVARSLDAGKTWQSVGRLPPLMTAIVIDPLAPSTIYAGSSFVGVFKSTDGGNNWSHPNEGLPSLEVWALAVDPVNSSTVYAATSLGIWKSINGGAHWSAINEGLTSSLVLALAVDRSDTSKLYAGTSSPADGFVTKLGPTGSISYSSYLGGSNAEIGRAIALDAAGNIYVTGSTLSRDLPLAHPLQPELNGVFGDAFVMKLTPSGGQLAYSTYLGGSQDDFPIGIAVTPAGGAWIVGTTFSSDLPTVNSLQPPGAGSFVFIAKLNLAGEGLSFLSYLGRTLTVPVGGAGGIFLDWLGSAYVTGGTNSPDFPTTPGAFQRNLRSPFTLDAFVAKISGVPDFDLCLQDESNSSTLQINAVTGDYQFTSCGGVTLSGTGAITRRGCLITLQVNGPDRRLLARIDTCMNIATASIQLLSQGAVFTILDRNTSNNTCVCAR